MRKNLFRTTINTSLSPCRDKCEIPHDDQTGNPYEESELLTEITASKILQPEKIPAAIINSNYSIQNFPRNALFKIAMKVFFDSFIYRLIQTQDRLFNQSVGKNSRGNRQWHIESYCFEYKSVSASNEEIILSGRVTFPNNTVDGCKHYVKSLTIYNHHVLNSHSGTPTLALSPMVIHSLYNSAVIEPDYEGYGSTSDRPHCGSSFMPLARQTADCTMAALDVMRRHGVKLAADGYSTNWGYSLGGSPALAFARYMDTSASEEMRQAIKLKSTYTGGGPFRTDEMISYMDNHFSFNPKLTTLLLKYLSALRQDQLGGYDFKDFCPEWMQRYEQIINGKRYTYLDAWRLGISRPEEIPAEYGYQPESLKCHFASDMCTKDGHFDYDNPKTVTLLKIFHDNSDWDDWVPRTAIYMSHCPNDDAVPYKQAKELYELLSGKSSSLKWRDTSAGVIGKLIKDNHRAVSFKAIINMTRKEEPADMF